MQAAIHARDGVERRECDSEHGVGIALLVAGPGLDGWLRANRALAARGKRGAAASCPGAHWVRACEGALKLVSPGISFAKRPLFAAT